MIQKQIIKTIFDSLGPWSANTLNLKKIHIAATAFKYSSLTLIKCFYLESIHHSVKNSIEYDRNY